ncbi:MAG: enoyl-ACP reductase FabI [Xanthobacteraceae bacterium]
MFSLTGKVGLVVGIADERSIAWGCANAFRDAGAELAITYLNARAEPYVRPLAERLAAPVVLPLDVNDDVQMDAVFEAIDRQWGHLDFLLHSIAYCPKDDLHGRVVDASRDGFGFAMDVSCHSFIRMLRRAEPLMRQGGACLTVSFLGSMRVVNHYGIMGPVKAALEATVRYAAAELGPKGITVNALSPGPLRTRAASGISSFDELLDQAAARAPTHQLSTVEDVGACAAFFVSDCARNITGGIHNIDGGYSITG